MENNTQKIIYQHFITPMQKPRASYIGIEIEMPIVNLNGDETKKSVCINAVKKGISRFGFEPKKFDDNGVCHEAVCEDTSDVFSFDCSYNNFEISLGRVRTLHEAQARFRDYVSFINSELKQHNHILTGMGINPNYKINNFNFVQSPRYSMLEGYLKKCKKWDGDFHTFYGFGTFSSASQVQLDVSEENIFQVIKAFTLAEPLKAVLFANSFLPEKSELLCARDYLWEKSPHGINPKNVGFFEPLPNSTDELTDYLSKAGIFCAERNKKYLFFRPVPFDEYLNLEKIDAEYFDGRYHNFSFTPENEDIEFLRTYKHIDLTARGTLEFRSACTQPLSEAMTVAAFHLGLIDKSKELTNLLMNSFLYADGDSPAKLRQKMNRADFLSFFNPNELKSLLNNVLTLCSGGLKERGYAEEIYLKPLYLRAQTLRSPSKYLIENQNQIKTVIEKFAELQETL